MPGDNLKAIATLLKGLPSRDEFVKSFAGVVKNVKDFEAQLTTDFKGLVATLTKKTDDKLATIKDGKDGKDGRDGVDAKGERGEQGPPGESITGPAGTNGKDGSPDTAEDIRNKLELLDGDERLDAKYIKNLPKSETVFQGGAVHGPLWSLPDVDVVGIVIGQSIKWDGIRWIPFTPSGANTSVFGEAPTDTGDQTHFTLAHTPATGTVRLYRDGAYQQSGVDYTISGATITLTNILLSGEILQADYEY